MKRPKFMPMRLWRNRKDHESNDAMESSVHAAIEKYVTRVRGVDPESRAAWSRLQSAIASETVDARRARIPARSWVPRIAFSISFVAACVVVVSLLFVHHPSDKVVETPRAQHTRVLLADSTEVLLNHTSRLTMLDLSSDKERRVILEGEAYFHVKHNGTPFLVTTDAGTVRVLGTEFNVRYRHDQLEVAVTHGSVRVSSAGLHPDSSVVLSAAQITVCTKGNVPDGPTAIDAAQYPGWVHDRLVFYRATLESVCRELEDQFDVKVTIANPGLRNETITGTLDGRNVGTSLEALGVLTGHSYRHENATYILY